MRMISYSPGPRHSRPRVVCGPPAGSARLPGFSTLAPGRAARVPGGAHAFATEVMKDAAVAGARSRIDDTRRRRFTRQARCRWQSMFVRHSCFRIPTRTVPSNPASQLLAVEGSNRSACGSRDGPHCAKQCWTSPHPRRRRRRQQPHFAAADRLVPAARRGARCPASDRRAEKYCPSKPGCCRNQTSYTLGWSRLATGRLFRTIAHPSPTTLMSP